MKKALLLIGVGVGFGLLLFLAVRSSGPRHEGRSAAGWVEQLHSTSAVAQWEAEGALRALGTSAIPVLVDKLRDQDSTLRSNLTATLRKQDLVPVPRSSVTQNRQDAVRGFAALGADVEPAVAALVRLLDDPRSADHASYALMQMSDRVIPALLIAVTNSGLQVRRRVIGDLGSRHTNAPGVEMALVDRMLRDPDLTARSLAALSLAKVPDLSEPAIRALIAALQDPATMLFAAHALAEAGTNARLAVPALEQMLREPAQGTGASSVRKALTRIDPTAPGRLGFTYTPQTNRYE